MSNKKIANEELGRLSVEDFKQAEKLPVVVVLDNVRSAHNVGSVFRTSDAFSIQEILLCGITPQPPQKEILKTALGSTESVSWQHFATTIEGITYLKEKGYRIIGIEQTQASILLDEFEPIGNSPIALVFGNEVFGVEQEVIDTCDACIEIPQTGTKHSLNISVSAGIVIWEIAKKYAVK